MVNSPPYLLYAVTSPAYLFFPFVLLVNSLHWARIPLNPTLRYLESLTTILPSWSNALYISSIALTIVLYHARYDAKDHMVVDTSLPKLLYSINALLAFVFRWRHFLFFISVNGLTQNSLTEFADQLVSTPSRVLYLFDDHFLAISLITYLYYSKNKSKEASSHFFYSLLPYISSLDR